jgi:LDH2 family malate/lactate/ureidoglycolate dehydrogenase
MPETYFIIPESQHNALVEAAYRRRGYLADEASDGARLCAEAARHGIRTHNAIKALHLDQLFGSGSKGCVPGARIEEVPSRFAATKAWNANRKLGQPTAYRAMEAAIALADRYGVGTVTVDNAFHYLWGGGYVMDAARRGYVAYTQCTAALAEVVPFGGRFPTLGTNPHSWGFPTTSAVGYPVVVDWATSVIAMGRVQQLKREGLPLPPQAAVDREGKATTDPEAAVALLPFGGHKGYGLSLVNEIVGALIGGSLPTLRSRWDREPSEKHTCAIFFQVIHPDAISGGSFAKGRGQAANVKAVIEDVLGHGNEKCLLPGQIEADWARRSAAAGGLLFTQAEIGEFGTLAREAGLPGWDSEPIKSVIS